MKHTCPRCGFQSGHEGWYDRNPVAAAIASVPIIIFCIAALIAYPWFLVPVLIVAVGVWVDRRRRKQAAITAWADWDYRQQMAGWLWNGHAWEAARR